MGVNGPPPGTHTPDKDVGIFGKLWAKMFGNPKCHCGRTMWLRHETVEDYQYSHSGYNVLTEITRSYWHCSPGEARVDPRPVEEIEPDEPQQPVREMPKKRLRRSIG